MSRSAAALLLMSFALGCGKYGPPVRAGAEQEPARKPGFEVPLPVIREPAAPEAAPPVPEVEEEPPPEGTP